MKYFEVIPYLIIQNCIKYSPKHKTITINTQESGTLINTTIECIGPRLEEEEQKKLYTIGFRGDNAKKFSSDGNGIGLFFLHLLVSKHQDGKIDFYQNYDSTELIDDIPFCKTYFNISFQKAGVMSDQDNNLFSRDAFRARQR